MIVVLWIINFIISWTNAWGVGKTWTESKAVGGAVHFMSWMGAIMAAVGFTWCYAVIVAAIAPFIMITDDATGVAAPLLDTSQVKVFCDLAYIILVFPLIGSGMAITTHSWGVFWRRRSLGNGAIAGWNTFAQISNFYQATEHLPNAIGNVGGFFSSSKDNDNKGVIILLVAMVAFGGILTTAFIIRHTARETARTRQALYG